MKIELELSRDEAHALNNLITQGYRAKDNCSYLEHEDHTAVAQWNRAYTEAMPAEESHEV